MIRKLLGHVTSTINCHVGELQKKNNLPNKLACDMKFADLKALLVNGNRVPERVGDDRYTAMVMSLARGNSHHVDFIHW